MSIAWCFHVFRSKVDFYLGSIMRFTSFDSICYRISKSIFCFGVRRVVLNEYRNCIFLLLSCVFVIFPVYSYRRFKARLYDSCLKCFKSHDYGTVLPNRWSPTSSSPTKTARVSFDIPAEMGFFSSNTASSLRSSTATALARTSSWSSSVGL